MVGQLRLLSSDACRALHLMEGQASVLRVLTGRAGRVAGGQVTLDLVLQHVVGVLHGVLAGGEHPATSGRPVQGVRAMVGVW